MPGETLGEMSLVDKEARSATAVALTPCKLVEVDENRFKFLVQQTPFFCSTSNKDDDKKDKMYG